MPSEPQPAHWLVPQWPVDARVDALMSTRLGGVSTGRWRSLNLGLAVGDDPAAVAENRRRFAARLGSPAFWLRQVHGCTVLRARAPVPGDEPPVADACWTDEPGVACAVQVADCLPVLLAAPQARAVAAAHAGWRGLAAGVLETTVQALCGAAGCTPEEVVAWLGPCIGPRQFEVGADVLQAFGQWPARADARFVARTGRDGTPRWLADLPRLARDRLGQAGVRQISGGRWCTVEDESSFFSFRRDGVTGRMAAAVCIRG